MVKRHLANEWFYRYSLGQHLPQNGKMVLSGVKLRFERTYVRGDSDPPRKNATERPCRYLYTVISAHAEQVVKRSIDVNNEIDLSSIGETAVFPTSHIPVFIFPQVTI